VPTEQKHVGKTLDDVDQLRVLGRRVEIVTIRPTRDARARDRRGASSPISAGSSRSRPGSPALAADRHRRAFSRRVCSVGTHPTMPMRSSTSRRPDLGAGRVTRRWSRSARRVSTTLRLQARATRRARVSHPYRGRAAKRAPPRHSCAEADADVARILEEESRAGAFPAVLHCTRGARLRCGRSISVFRSPSPASLTFKKSDDLRAIAAALPADASWWRPTRPIWRPASCGAAQRAVLCGGRQRRCWRKCARCRRDRAPDHGPISFACFRKSPANPVPGA